MASIAFPALGTGNLGYDHSAVATAMFETVRSFIEGSVYTSLKEVVFNVFDEKSKEVYFFSILDTRRFYGIYLLIRVLLFL